MYAHNLSLEELFILLPTSFKLDDNEHVGSAKIHRDDQLTEATLMADQTSETLKAYRKARSTAAT